MRVFVELRPETPRQLAIQSVKVGTHPSSTYRLRFHLWRRKNRRIALQDHQTERAPLPLPETSTPQSCNPTSTVVTRRWQTHPLPPQCCGQNSCSTPASRSARLALPLNLLVEKRIPFRLQSLRVLSSHITPAVSRYSLSAASKNTDAGCFAIPRLTVRTQRDRPDTEHSAGIRNTSRSPSKYIPPSVLPLLNSPTLDRASASLPRSSK